MGSPGARGRVTDAITFDAGALIAIEHRSKRMQALLDEIDRRDWRIAVPAGALAQAWRGGPRQSQVVALDDPVARAVGLLCGRSGHADVVDVSVALCARQRNRRVITSDPDDLRSVDDRLILHVP